MKISIFLLITIPILFSCNPKQNKNNNQYLIKQDSTLVIDSTELDEEYESYKTFSYAGINIFEPMPYNQSDYTSEIFNIMDTIVGLFKKDGQFYLKKCWIEKVNVYENECYGGAMMEPTLNRQEDKCLYLFRGLYDHSLKNVLDTVPANIELWVGEKYDFKFANMPYQLRADGKILDKGSKSWDDIDNYKLYLTSGNKTQCILKMSEFNDTTTQILFIGDIDGDNKPDYIISSPDWYEDYCVLLFLSSFAEGDEIVKLVAVTSDSFAC